MAKKLFSDDAFDKHLSIGDELSFDKPELTKLRIDLTWAGTDLDICAFLLDKDGVINEKADLVYFKSGLRWKTTKDFTDPAFDPLDGKFSTWPAPGFKNPKKWMEATLPISGDGAVIGSWDDMSSSEDEDCGESMHVLLDEVDTTKHSSIVLAAAVAKDKIKLGETFADAHNPIVTIYDAENDTVIAEYKLASTFVGKDAVCFGKLEFDQDSYIWNFIPMAEGYNGGMEFLAREIFN